MRRLAGMLAALLAAALPAAAEPAGDFDYYVLALSWSPAWCALEGDARGDPQCDAGRGQTFVLHGLWPQYEEGWPEFCRTAERDPTRAETAAMAGIMGGAGAAFRQWQKHGRCSGLAAAEYFRLARRAFSSVTLPPVLAGVTKRLTVPAAVVEAAFLDSNPGLAADQITVTCRDGLIREVRLCLTRELEPRRCGADTLRDCRLRDAVLEPLR